MHRKLGLLAICCAVLVTGVLAQGPMQDRVIVDLPYAVTVQDKTLEPGEYVIQEPGGSGDTKVLQIFRDGGMVFETTVMTIDSLKNQIPEETSLQLQQVGDDYYLDKMWIAGKTYGYEFVLPDRVRERQQEMRESRVSGRAEHGEALSSEANQAGQSAESAVAAGEAKTESAAGSVEQGAESAANSVEQGAESAANKVEQGAESAAGGVESGARSAAGAVEQGAESAANAVTDQPNESAQQQASAAGNEVSSESQSAAASAGQGAENAANSVEQGAQSAANTVEQGAESAGNAVQEGAQSAAGAVERQAEQAGINDRNNDNLVAQNRGMEQPGQPGAEESSLPQTASPLPLIALLGLGSLATGAASRLRRRQK